MHLVEFGPGLWIVDGPVVAIGGFQYRTRMAVARLSHDSSAWIWSPIPLTKELVTEILEIVGPVKHIVSPNKLHHLNLQQWSDRFPEARVYAPPGLKGRFVVKDLHFTDELDDAEPIEAFVADFDQITFRNSFTMEEVVFFHKPSRTALFCDLIQRYKECECKGWRGIKRRWDGLVGETGGTPREWIWSFRRGKSNYQEARKTIVSEWKPDRMIVAHGECVQEKATLVISQALKWAESI